MSHKTIEIESTNPDWFSFIQKIKPDGKAYRAIGCTQIMYEVIANAMQELVDYGISTINDQVWYVNDNFDPEPWELRYEIEVPEITTLDERREVVKGYMLYPQYLNRLSRDYIQIALNDLGYTGITVTYNPTGANEGFLRANDFSDEKDSFLLGSNTYNSFILEGTASESQYHSIIKTVMSLKPLQVAVYDKIQVQNSLALDINTDLALDETLTLAIQNL